MMMDTFRDGMAARWALPYYDQVWRTTSDEKGYAVLSCVREMPTSRELRHAMFEVVAAFNRLAPRKFVLERLGRFDQQVSTRFHRDGGPDASLLLLGYEPTTVTSELFIHDPYRQCHWQNLSAYQYLKKYHPLTVDGDRELSRSCTSILARPKFASIVIINNSAILEHPPQGHPLGVLHKGLIREPDLNSSRVINSMGLMLEGEVGRPPVGRDRIDWFRDADTLD